MDDSHKLEWKIYWAFRNGDYNLAAKLLAFYWTTDTSNLKLDNVKGNYNDTLLHLACQNGWLDYIKFLIEEFGCEAEVKDCGNQTPLHYACHYGHLNIVQYLTRVHNCDIAVATRDHWTPLHYACRYGHLNIVEYILDIPGVTNRQQLRYVVCKYYSLNDEFRELVYLMDKHSNPIIRKPLSILLQIACSFHQVQIIEYLCNKHGSHWYLDDTEIRRLFIFCCKYGLLEIVTQLRVNVADHVDTRGKSGLHYACQEGHISIAKYLIEVCGCDVNKVDRNGDTPLHLCCQHSHNIDMIKYMLSEAKRNPNIENKIGEIPIKLLMSDTKMWYGSECIEVIKALVASKQWDPNSSCNSNGDTALHLSVRHHRPRVVHYLLSKTKSDPNSKNSNGKTPLQLALSTDIINDLIRYGSNPDNVYKLYGKSVRLKKPLRPPVKVFIIGNSGVGKSTLTEALKIEASPLTRAFSTRRRVSDVDEKTAGIVPHDFKSKKYGRVTFYDFAGHREFYSSHAAFLHNVIQGSSPIFLLVVNMNTQNDIIQQNILYWLSFVENQCRTINCTSHVIVIGSHADIVLSGGDDPQQKAMEISDSIRKIFHSSIVEYVTIHPMDCQFPQSPGVTKLRHCLIEICNAVRIPEVITFNAHCFHVFLLDKFRTSVAVTVQEIQDQVMKEQNLKKGIVMFLPDTSTTISKVCDELNNRGHILFLKSSNNTKISWVIIDKARLLSEVTGTIFAPKDFKQHCQLAESTGVVPLSRLTKHFLDLKLEVLIGFMIHLEFCCEILDSDLLKLIMKHQESANKADTVISDSERYFLFPGLITQQAPDNLWEHNQDFKYHCGWILQCTHPNQFFTSRLLQVLLLRLAFTFALIKMEVNETIPAFQRECSVWKNGIFWGEIFGMEAIIEVHSSNKTIVFQSRCQEESLLHCITQRSQIIRKILQCVHDFCPQTKTTESFINPSEAKKFPIQLSKLPQYTVQKIAEAIINSNDCYPLSVVSSTRIIPLDRLLTFEPYAEIGLSMLKHLYSDHVKKLSDQKLETLRLNLSKKSDLFIKIFRLKSQSTIPAPDNLLTVLKQWRDGCEGMYKCLKEKLDQYSIFAGRNVLELSGVQLQDDTDHTEDTNDAHDDQDQAHSEMLSTITNTISKERSTKFNMDKPLQGLPDSDEINEDEISPLSIYETATKLHPDYYDSEEGGIDIITRVQLEYEPKLSELQLLKGRGGRRVRVIEGVASKWEDLATALNFDGPRIDTIRRDLHYQSESACRQMLIKWLKGEHDLKGPVTWATLIQCLIDAGLVDIADGLKELIDS